ncbi:hypothetical protein P8452_27063 [Trifolium repens]|nr:hypothetical protein P8452_27063 [Trifolium repens]
MFDLPVDGKAVTGVSEWYYNDLCPDYLGKTPIKPDILARRPLEKIKEINDTKSLWRISIRLKDLWIVPHGKTQKHHFEMVVRDDLGD